MLTVTSNDETEILGNLSPEDQKIYTKSKDLVNRYMTVISEPYFPSATTIFGYTLANRVFQHFNSFHASLSQIMGFAWTHLPDVITEEERELVLKQLDMLEDNLQGSPHSVEAYKPLRVFLEKHNAFSQMTDQEFTKYREDLIKMRTMPQING